MPIHSQTFDLFPTSTGACGILSGDSAGGNGGSGIAIVTEYCSL